MFEETFGDNGVLKTIEEIPSTVSLIILFANNVTSVLRTYKEVCTEVPWIFFISPICLKFFHLAAKNFSTMDKIKLVHQDVQVIKQERLVSFHIKWPYSLDWRPPWYSIVLPLSQKKVSQLRWSSFLWYFLDTLVPNIA